jgi:hypothetical protein
LRYGVGGYDCHIVLSFCSALHSRRLCGEFFSNVIIRTVIDTFALRSASYAYH